jgi:hypothetical protein
MKTDHDNLENGYSVLIPDRTLLTLQDYPPLQTVVADTLRLALTLYPEHFATLEELQGVDAICLRFWAGE